MKKIILCIIVIFSICQGCKKTESDTEIKVASFKNMAKSLGMDPKLFKDQSILSIYNRYETLENWKQAVLSFKQNQKKNQLLMSSGKSTAKKSPGDIEVTFTYGPWHGGGMSWYAEIPEDREILLSLIDQGLDVNHNLPWADLAGASGVCAMKQLSGVPVYDYGSFLSDDQHDLGYFLPCTTYPTDNLIAQTHVESEL